MAMASDTPPGGHWSEAANVDCWADTAANPNTTSTESTARNIGKFKTKPANHPNASTAFRSVHVQ